MNSRHFPEEPSRGFPSVVVGIIVVVVSVILLVVMSTLVEFSHVSSSSGWVV